MKKLFMIFLGKYLVKLMYLTPLVFAAKSAKCVARQLEAGAWADFKT